jgi:hypothetical protein
LGVCSQVSPETKQAVPTIVGRRMATQHRQKKREVTEEAGKKPLALTAQPCTLVLPLQEKDEAAAAGVKAQGPATHQVGHIAYDNRSNQPP